ncbi:hypothetical protein PspKH34_08220 [Parageobacillus sp. KH3-4]|nr:hypothetical protein PspKH34_08220 [Parageobacillus sp. KH3-4]
MLPLDELTSECQPERYATSKVGRVENALASLVTKKSDWSIYRSLMRWPYGHEEGWYRGK